MNRYLFSFLLTLFIYVTISGGFFYFNFEEEQITVKQMENKITFKIMRQSKIITEIQHVVKEKILQKVIQEIVTKKVVVKKRKVINKKVRKVKRKTKVYKKIIKKTIIPKKAIIDVISEKIVNKVPIEQIDYKETQFLQNQFLTKLKQQINIHKYYPRVAKKRNIEGYVNINFTLLENGFIININLKGNKRYFEKSVNIALEESFPISTLNSGFSFPLEVNFKINFQLFE